MPCILLIDKNGEIKNETYKKIEISDLYKKCGYRKTDNYEELTRWNVKCKKEKYVILVFGKKVGKHSTENKYEFPPPIDQTLFFGTLAVINYDVENNKILDLSHDEWTEIYEKLFGGFEDLKDTEEADNNEIDELELISPDKKTKTGYLKDDFVVDDSLSESDDDDDDDDDVVEEEYYDSE
mgnify:CR=1 FL=1|tara:strand:+ start:66 stop:608 length:543 start_codon:yes stop_codon:yes gene_type:complete